MSYLKKFDLSNKVAFVVGGSGYIGSEISSALASLNCKVVILDKFPFKGKNKDKIFYSHFDLKQTNNLENSLKKVIKKNGIPNIFINASYPYTKDWKKNNFKQITLKSFEANIKLHLNSYIWMSKLVANIMVKKKIKGSIINLSSIYGVVGQDLSIYKGTKMTESLTYSAVKGSINSITKQMSSFYGPNGIRVNAICPGGVINKEDRKKLKINYRFQKNYLNKVPLKRFARTDDVASAAIFLSSEASSYITGILLMVDGGWTAI